jgi:hypothetical protein
MSHIILLGDSILDNAAYVRAGDPAVINQVRPRLPDGWHATLLAVDGSTTDDVAHQLTQVPADASHLVVSVGGNDALQHSFVLNERTQTVATAMLTLAEIRAHFAQQYAQMLQAVLRHNLPTVLCTVYDPCESDPTLQQVEATALTVFNDFITRAAIQAGLPLIDLRLVCTVPEDYANPIEPSAAGGAKIAAAIVRAVTQHTFTTQQTVVYT